MTIRNTTQEMNRGGALGFLAEAMFAGGGSQAIERQEARGQRELVAAAQLPAKGLSGVTVPGLIDHGPTDGDSIFRSVTLPDGWQKRATDHSMWSDLLDGYGRKRAAIFYKAAFYDRSAHMHWQRRFEADHYGPDITGDQRQVRIIDHASGEVVFATDIANVAELRSAKDWRGVDMIEARQAEAAAAWFATNRPDHGDPAAYWDEPSAA